MSKYTIIVPIVVEIDDAEIKDHKSIINAAIEKAQENFVPGAIRGPLQVAGLGAAHKVPNKRILALKEHHGTVYLDVSSPQQLLDACLSVVRGRFGDANEMPEKPPETCLTPELIATLPVALRHRAEELQKQYEADLDQYERQMQIYKLINRCLETNDGHLAKRILEMRRGFEDEHFTIETVHDLYQT